MSDVYGALPIPAPAPAADDVCTDPGLQVLLDFCQAALNAHMTDAWQAVCPGKRPVEAVFAVDPEREYFNDKTLPALFGYRKGGQPAALLAQDWRTQTDTVVLLWVLPSTAQARQRLRSPAVAGLCKVLDRSIYRGREPAYAKANDPDPMAATLDPAPEAIKSAVATSTAAESYSGAELDGAVGVGAISPPRGVTITRSGTLTDFALGSTVTVHGTNPLGLPISETLVITSATTYKTSVAFATVDTIDVDAQLDTGGIWQFGLGAFEGLGSVLLRHTGAERIDNIRQGTPRLMSIRPADGQGAPLTYPCVEVHYQLLERLHFDPAEYDVLGGTSGLGQDLSIAQSDGGIVEQALI